MSWQLASVLPAWVLALAGAIAAAVIPPPAQYLTWIGLVLAAVVIATFGIQLAIQRKDGFVVRAMASIGGAFVILAVASGLAAASGTVALA